MHELPNLLHEKRHNKREGAAEMNIDKYLKITRWAKNRYRKNGKLILSIGGNPSKWSKIEKMAFDKYIF